METLIREGALRHLLNNDVSCDVILSCQGHRLMAHKLILSMASSVFRTLLLESNSESSVIILPDVSCSTMSLILDYVYTGSVVVYSNTIQEFLSLVNLFKISIQMDTNTVLLKKNGDFDEIKDYTKESIVKKEIEQMEFYNLNSKKCTKKLPSLIPLRPRIKTRKGKSLCNYIIPSPWCPSREKVFGDPKAEGSIAMVHNSSKIVQNDRNNNLEMPKTTHFSTLSNETEYINSDNMALRLNNHKIGQTERFTNQLDRRKSCTQSISHPNFPTEKITQYNSGMGISHPPLNPKRNFSTISRENDLEQSKYNLEHLHSNFRNDNDSSNSSVDVTSNSPNEILELNQKNRSVSPLSHENTSDSITSSSYDKDELVPNGHNSVDVDKTKPYRCNDCGKGFSQMRNYKYHRSLHEGTKEFSAKCPECGKTFNDKGYLSSHMKIHRDKKEYACPHCPKRFNQRVAYNMHLRIHTGVKPHECTTCGKSFSRKMLLKQHQRVHTGERPYSCPECGKTFADRSNMSLHARLHTGIKPYSCNLCSKSFTKKHHLKTHMNFHTGLKPYTCQKCGLAFSQSSNMRTHYKKCMLKNPQDPKLPREKKDVKASPSP